MSEEHSHKGQAAAIGIFSGFMSLANKAIHSIDDTTGAMIHAFLVAFSSAFAWALFQLLWKKWVLERKGSK